MRSSARQGREPSFHPLLLRNYWGIAARVTSDPTSAVTTGITAITAAAAAALATGWEDATPNGEGRVATSLLPPPLVVTHCRLGLHSSHTGGGEIPSPASP